MKFCLRKYIKYILSYNIFIFLIHCGGPSDYSAAPGICTLDCTAGSLAANDMRITFLPREEREVTWSCISPENRPFPTSIRLQFIIEKPRAMLPAETNRSQTVGSTFEETEASRWVPVSNVDFHPVIVGGVMADKNPTLPNYDFLAGVQTPESEWCTDSCGIGTVIIKPYCLFDQAKWDEDQKSTENPIIVDLVSGGLMGSTQFSVWTPFAESD